MKPEIQNFISEYINSFERKSVQEWAEKYNVDRVTIGRWIAENRQEIDRGLEENVAESRKMFKNRIQRANERLGELLESSETEDVKFAVKLILDKTVPNITSQDVKLTGEVKQSALSIAIDKARSDVTGG